MTKTKLTKRAKLNILKDIYKDWIFWDLTSPVQSYSF